MKIFLKDIIPVGFYFIFLSLFPTQLGLSQNNIQNAAKMGDTILIKNLINNKVDVNDRDTTSWTPIMYAVRYNHLDIVKILVENNADLNIKDENDITPLMIAARYGYYDIAEFILNNGGDVSARNKSGSSALIYAISQNHKDIADILEKYERKRAIEIIEETPEVFSSPIDEYGVPEGLYLNDSKLLKYKTDIYNHKISNQRIGKKLLIFGSGIAACGILIMAISGGRDNYELTQYEARTGIDIFDYGIALAIVGLGIDVGAISLKLKPVSSRELKDYYNEQYGKYLELSLCINF